MWSKSNRPGSERFSRREERKMPIEIHVDQSALGSSYFLLIRVYSCPFAIGFLTAHRFKVDNRLLPLLSSL